jgi:hypothetical protein
MIRLKGDNETFKIVAEWNSALFRTHDSNEAFYSNQNDQQKNLTKEKKENPKISIPVALMAGGPPD